MQGKKRLFIIGASDFGREIESYLDLYPENDKDLKVEGYLDDNLEALNDFPSEYKVLGTIQDYVFRQNDRAILALADPQHKERIFNYLKHKVKFITYIAPNSIICKYTKFGEGCIICPGSVIGPNVELGKAVTINSGTLIGHDTKINEFCSLMSNITIGGHSKIGNRVFIGSDSTIIPKRKICDNAVIGAGSVVIKNVNKTRTVFGNPADYF